MMTYRAVVNRLSMYLLAVWCVAVSFLFFPSIVKAAPDWKAQGPSPIQESSGVTNIQPNNPVYGAIQSVLVHPTQSSTIYVGTVNGGIWKTTNGGTNWTPLTDDQRSLSIGAMAFDASNPNRLVASLAVFSNFRGVGGPRLGLISSTDGGASWSPLGSPFLNDTEISALLCNKQTIWAASRDWLDGGKDGKLGLFLSGDSGRSFQLVSGTGGLPTGGVTSVAWNPRNYNQVYAALAKDGIYRTANGGQTWTKISIPDMNIGSQTSNILLSVGAGGQSLFVAIAKTYPDPPNEKGPKERLESVWRSLDGGATWKNLGGQGSGASKGLPGSTEDNGFFGVNPGGQADINLSLLADPVNPNLVYIAGDAQPAKNEGETDANPKFPNSIGADGYTGRLFRGDASLPLGQQWTPITDNYSNPKSGPHADSRWLAIDAQGNLLEVDDGGIYRRTSAGTNQGTWQSLNGNLQITEFYPNNIAYDRNTKTLLGGNQDNGVAAQQSPGGLAWTAGWSGDGGRVAINDANPDFSVRYGSSQNLSGFGRYKVDRKNITIEEKLAALQVGGLTLENYETSKGSTIPFTTPVVLNQADKSRLAFGTKRVYLTTDQVNKPLSDTLQLTDISTTNFQNEVGALAYGRPGNVNLLAVGEGPRLWLTTTLGAGSLKQLSSYQSTSQINNIFINPTVKTGDKEIFYVSDGSTLQASNDSGASWGTSISLPQMTSLQFITANNKNAVVAGGYGVLYASRDTDLANWVSLIGNLPKTLISGLDYSKDDDLLVVGTTGRGAFTLSQVSTFIPDQAPLTVDAGWLRLLDNDSLAQTLNGGILQATETLNWNKNLSLTAQGGSLDTNDFACLVSGKISGSGALTKTGGGVLTLSASNSYSGGSIFYQGTVKVASDANLGAVTGGLTFNGGTLQVGGNFTTSRPVLVNSAGGYLDIQNFSATLNGNLTGKGLLILQGNGEIHFYGNGSAFAGALMTNPADTDQTFFLESNGRLEGSLTLANVTNNGEINPGESPGILSVSGTYTQMAGGSFIAEIASATSYDVIEVTGNPGTANLAGTIAPVLLDGFQPRGNQVFAEVLTASGGVTGTFNTIENQQITPTLSWQARYDPDSVDLWVQRDYTNAGLGLNANQRAVGAALNSLAGVTSGDLDTVLNTVDYLPSAAAVQEALREISPEKSAALANLAFTGASFQMRNQAQRLTDLRFGDRQAGLGGGLAGINPMGSSQFNGLMLAFHSPDMTGLITREQPAAPATPWGVYLYPSVILGNQKSTANQTGYNFYLTGFTLGADYRIRDTFLVGLATGYSYTKAAFEGSGGGVQANTWPLTVYAAYLEQSFYAYGSLGYVLNLFDQQRGIRFGGLKRTANSNTAGNQFNVYAEAGYDLKPKPFIVTPVVSLAYSGLWLNGYSESGAGSLNLDVASQNATSVQTGVGLKLALPCQWGGSTLAPQVYATYQHEFANDSRGLNASLSQGGSTFTFQTDAPSRDFAVVGGKLDLLTRKNLQVSLNYNAEVGRASYLAQSIYTGVRWQF